MLTSSSVDPHLLAGLIIALVLSFSISFIPLIQRDPGLGLISIAGAVLFYRKEFTGFIVVAGLAYLAVRSLNAQTNPAARWRRACLAIILLVILFTIGRVFHWDRAMALPGSIRTSVCILDMWLTLRLVTLFWEVGSGTIDLPSFYRYIIWICLPFTLGGPLLRFSQMPKTLQIDRRFWTSAGWWTEGLAAAAKLVLGIALGIGYHLMASRWPQAHLWNNAVQTFVAGPLGFYLTLAGYFHLMEVLGRPAGFKLPTSFNYPIGRENISAFWMNWNMTATFVFRDYLFYNRWGLSTYNIYVNTLILFTLVGLWHAANTYWVLWGFLHGLLFCTYLLWRKYGQRIGHLPLRGTTIGATGARLLTYLCVCMCWYLPSKIIQKLGGLS
jgi:D-alanyl-lipoteichoic acid acyltransferase DltB (MBOAT superfamily)